MIFAHFRNPMATILRSSINARLSHAISALSRLRLQHAGPSNVSRHATQHRTFSQSRISQLKTFSASSTTTTTLGQDPSPPKHASSTTNPPILSQIPMPLQPTLSGRKIRAQRKDRPAQRWSDEEDKELLRLAKEGKESYDVYANHFRHRSYRSVSGRMSYALIADRILRQHAQGIQSGGEEEEGSAVVDAVLAAGESAPLRTLYVAIKSAKSQQRNADKSDDSIQRSRVARKYTPVVREWTLEDDTLLKQLVQEHIDIPEPSIWHKVSGGTIDGAILLRTVPSCIRRWKVLYPPPLGQTGRWSAEEESRLQEAISEQFEGKYQVLIDVMLNKDLVQAKEKQMRSLVERSSQQLPSQSSLPILKPGSRRLRMLNWVMIAEKVQSRSYYECREHFHSTYHNGNRGTWSEDELKRAKEGFEMFGSNSRKVAEHVGTRSPTQVSRLHSNLRFKENKQKLEALENTKMASEGKQ